MPAIIFFEAEIMNAFASMGEGMLEVAEDDGEENAVIFSAMLDKVNAYQIPLTETKFFIVRDMTADEVNLACVVFENLVECYEDETGDTRLLVDDVDFVAVY